MIRNVDGYEELIFKCDLTQNDGYVGPEVQLGSNRDSKSGKEQPRAGARCLVEQ